MLSYKDDYLYFEEYYDQFLSWSANKTKMIPQDGKYIVNS